MKKLIAFLVIVSLLPAGCGHHKITSVADPLPEADLSDTNWGEVAGHFLLGAVAFDYMLTQPSLPKPPDNPSTTS
jgi:hypothetical protein